MSHNNSLEPIEPRTAVQQYLSDRQTELSENTIYTHEKRLNKFIDWCNRIEITNMNNITGRKITEFREWRSGAYKKDEIAAETLRSCISTLRVFLEWCTSIEAVPQSLPEQVIIPNTSEVSDVLLDADHAEAILDHLSRYEYASGSHAVMRLLRTTGMRLGALIGLDLCDFNESKKPLEIEHRPPGTPLKGTAPSRSHHTPSVAARSRTICVKMCPSGRYRTGPTYLRKSSTSTTTTGATVRKWNNAGDTSENRNIRFLVLSPTAQLRNTMSPAVGYSQYLTKPVS